MILLTGASQGIGLACARELLARTDSRVVVTGRDGGRLTKAREGLPGEHRARFEGRVADQAREDDVAALSAWVAESPEPLEGAILGVAANPLHTDGPSRIHALGAATIAATIRTNCAHTLLLTAALLERMRRQRHGTLIWIGSLAAHRGLPGGGLYAATKSFLIGLAQTARQEYGGRGVRVHLVHPGPVRTPRIGALSEGFTQRHGIAVAEADVVARRMIDLFLSGDGGPVEVDLC